MARGDSLSRQLQLFMLFEAERELSVDRAVKRLGCNRRTVYRDLEVLQRAGLPLYQERVGKRARWRVTDGFRRRLQVAFTLEEALSLCAGAAALDALEGSLFHAGAQRAFEKVRASLSPDVRQRVDAVAKKLSVRAGARRARSESGGLFQALVEAVERTETVVLEYRKLTARRYRSYTVDPHHVHLQNGAVYVIGFAHERDDLRVFLLDRIAAVRRTGTQFSPRAIDPQTFVHGAFGVWNRRPVDIHLRFKGRAARLVAENTYHPSQQMQWTSDRQLDVTFRMPITPSFLAWVRGFGAQVEQLAPKRAHVTDSDTRT